MFHNKQITKGPDLRQLFVAEIIVEVVWLELTNNSTNSFIKHRLQSHQKIICHFVLNKVKPTYIS